MFTTFILVALFIGLLLASAVLWAFFLQFGLRWARVSNVTMGRVVVAAALVTAMQIVLNSLFQFAFPDSAPVIAGPCLLMLGVLMQCALIKVVFRLNLRQTIQAWLPTLSAIALTAAIDFIVRASLYQAFFLPTNAMAPTLVARHLQGVCPECKRPNYGSPVDARKGSHGLHKMICDNFHVAEVSGVDARTYACDRFMVGKFVTPSRWDMIVFRYPAKPELLYVKRLVGLPGETIQIRDGSVWADGQKLTPPEQIADLKYLDEIPEWPQSSLWGSANRPAVLGDDEFFVLGDFSAQSTDSRSWESGAATHSPFAVPESHIVGVVTHTFWPPSRFRVHR